MKKITLFIVLAFIIQTTVSSQPCLPEGITFTTQAEIDNFQTNYPNCTEIEGNIIISGTDITNLSGLSVLTSIGGDLLIWGKNTLTSLTGFDNVTFIGGYLKIYGNSLLTNLTGLDNVTFIGGHLAIVNNDAMISLAGLDNVTSIGGSLEIQFNYALTSLTGLDNVTCIEGSLMICDNAALTSLTGLDNVTSIVGYLWIRNNYALISLTGLENVTSIVGFLGIRNNDAMISLTGLDNIDAVSISNLYITHNSSLSTCEVQSVCDYLANPNGVIDIHDNATGCNSQAEVEEACGVWIPDINLKSEFLIYPNPAKMEIFILVKNGSIINEVNIYNQIGQKVLHKKRITNTIDVSKLRQGMYIIELVSSELKIRKKLIIR